jgi:receptor protein-tyrosine kinase
MGADGRSVGAILVDAGKLTLEGADQIFRLQKSKSIRFGEAALELRLLTEDDLQFALADQYGYPYLRRGASPVAEEVVAAYQPYSARVEGLRDLRSQLMLRWFTGEGGPKALAIVSPGRGEGRSYLAANLAVVFAQLGEATLLVDADLRHGRLHKLFGIDNRSGLSAVLSGRSPGSAIAPVPGLANLAVIVAGPTPPNPQELLGRDAFTRLIEQVGARFRVILIDTPAGAAYADAQCIGARAGGTLMVMRQNYTRIEIARKFGESLSQSGTPLVGAVLNCH